MSPKLAACCSKCDAEVFEVKIRDRDTRRALAIGAPLETAQRCTFVLFNGSQMDLTLCDECLRDLTPADYPMLWNRVMAGWIENSQPGNPWAASQVDNGIAGLLHVRPWKARNG